MVMRVGRESGLGPGMAAIRLENGELDNAKERKNGDGREVKIESKRETRIEMVLGPGCMAAGIPAVRCSRRHLLQAKQLGRVGERQHKELDAKRETREGERRGEEGERKQRSGCLYKLSQDVGNAAMAN